MSGWRRGLRAAAVAVAVTALAGGGLAADLRGSADHPLLPRYEGSEIIAWEQQAFASYGLAVAPMDKPRGKEGNAAALLPLEGRFTRIAYKAPAGRSELEVFRNYTGALRAAGFETVWTCERNACGGRYFSLAMAGERLYPMFGDQQADQHYIAARLPRPEGDVYASLYVIMHRSGGGPLKDRALALLEITEVKPMEQRMVVVDAPAMQRDLATAGRVAIHAIAFDFDKDTLRPDARPQLEEIARLLRAQPDLRVLVVGHTDARGAMDYNRDLSERRARAVVAALVRDHGIAAARLTPVGVGMATPMATNRTEDGRAQNRRVELVEVGE